MAKKSKKSTPNKREIYVVRADLKRSKAAKAAAPFTITVVFLGRRSVAGIAVGTRLVVDGVVGDHHGRQAILNPRYEILAGDAKEPLPTH